jgi:hypothetical protein
VWTAKSETEPATMQLPSATQLSSTVQNGLMDNIVSGQPIMHRQPATVKLIIAGRQPKPGQIFN